MRLTPKKWEEFQHYKDRSPTWIKLHKRLLDDFAFHRLPLASKALAPMLWLLASEYEAGVIDASLEEVAFRMHMTPGELAEALNPLIEAKFFTLDQSASNPLADCKQTAIPEKEKEKEKEKDDDDDEDAGAPVPLISSEANEIADAVAEVCGHDLEFLPPAWLGAPYRVQTWIANGWPREIILASCREQMAKKRDGPPDRIQYFEKGIAAAIAKHRAPLPEVKIIDAQTVEVRRGTTENLSQVARRLGESGIAFGPRPTLAPRDQGGGAVVRLLPEGRRERS